MAEGYPAPGAEARCVSLEDARKSCESFLAEYCLKIPSEALLGSAVETAAWWEAFARDIKGFLPLMPFQLRFGEHCILAHPTAAPLAGFFLSYDNPGCYEKDFTVVEIARRDLDPREYHFWLKDFDPIFERPQAVIGSGEECKSPFTHIDIAAVLAVNAAAYRDYLPERAVVAILLLRDGRFCYIMEHDGIESTLDDVYNGWDGYGCWAACAITAPSLESLVNYALDVHARRLLGLSHIDTEPMKVIQSPAIWTYTAETHPNGFDHGAGLRFPGGLWRYRLNLAMQTAAFVPGTIVEGNVMFQVRPEGDEEEIVEEEDPSRIVPLSLSEKDVVGTGLDGEEAFRVQDWAPMPCQSLLDKIAKAWNVASSQLVLLWEGSTMEPSKVVDDLSGVVLKKVEEPPSRIFGRKLFNARLAVDQEMSKISQAIANLPDQDQAANDELMKKWKSFREFPAVEQVESTQVEAAEGVPKCGADDASTEPKKARPVLQRQQSIVSQRKDKARKAMREDWTWDEHPDVLLFKQVQSWCKSQLPEEEHEPESSHEESKPNATMNVPEGMVLLPSKDDEGEFAFAPKARHKSRKHQKNKKGAPHGVTHNAQSLKLFAELHVKVPTTPEDIKNIMTEMDARLAAHRDEEEQKARQEADYWRRKMEGKDYWRNDHEGVECEWQAHWGEWKPNVNVWCWGPTFGKGSNLLKDPRQEEDPAQAAS